MAEKVTHTPEIERQRGFVQGIAWAIALISDHRLDADQMLFESGLRLVDFLDAKVPDSDLRKIKAAAKLGGVWDRRTANNGVSDTIVPAPAPHKKHPGFPLQKAEAK
jgi:hypothetical protein